MQKGDGKTRQGLELNALREELYSNNKGKRVYNFSAGPSCLAPEVMEEARAAESVQKKDIEPHLLSTVICCISKLFLHRASLLYQWSSRY